MHRTLACSLLACSACFSTQLKVFCPWCLCLSCCKLSFATPIINQEYSTHVCLQTNLMGAFFLIEVLFFLNDSSMCSDNIKLDNTAFFSRIATKLFGFCCPESVREIFFISSLLCLFS